ncbi:hypothetical protein [Bradyrhizobium sp. BR 10289]|uniref:hypothetical protein n=1 Tax=Bradyrhizobium sp. BR 10289 TaxID=2749993 RepID=UPI001C64FCF0|nr:hypothetical protein [Bradyrhizobium sp. BR 10289]MBW7971870.1 hypothetical protein [Bradyrhizobium sp. BR 10289]
MTRSDYVAPHLSFEAVCEQLEGIVRLGGSYFEPDAESIVAQACDDLRAIKDGQNEGQIIWSVPQDRPIRTIATNSYQRGNKGGLAAQACLSFIWEVKKVARKRDEFAIVGLCSTKITLHDTSDRLNGVVNPLTWTFEMGSHDSPGCHFHSQIDWKAPIKAVYKEEEMQAWPSLDVPRLPSLLVTPGDCLDYILGELFQEAWPKKYEETEIAHIGRWLSTSRQRIAAVLRSSLQAAEEGTSTSPWIAIKQWYPRSEKMLLT